MDTRIILGIITYFTLAILSRFLNEKSYQKLNEKDKIKIIDSFAGYRIYQTLPVIFIIILFFICLKFFTQYSPYIIISYVILILCYLIGLSYLSYQKLNKLSIPKEYINVFIYTQIIRLIGITILFYSIFQPLIQKYFRSS